MLNDLRPEKREQLTYELRQRIRLPICTVADLLIALAELKRRRRSGGQSEVAYRFLWHQIKCSATELRMCCKHDGARFRPPWIKRQLSILSAATGREVESLTTETLHSFEHRLWAHRRAEIHAGGGI